MGSGSYDKLIMTIGLPFTKVQFGQDNQGTGSSQTHYNLVCSDNQICNMNSVVHPQWDP